MAEWQIDLEPIPVATVGLNLTQENSILTVKNNGVAFDAIDLKETPIAMEVVGSSLFRRTAASGPEGAWITTAKPQDGSVSADIKSTGVQGGATRWFFIIGEGDIRNGLTVKMHSLEGRKVELFNIDGVFTVSRE